MTKTEPLRILILGGTSFVGLATVEAALDRGHDVTIFHRGKTRPNYFGDRVTELLGDRDPDKDDGLKALEKGQLENSQWDVVIDVSGYFPRMVRASAELLAKRVKHYIFISTVSVYRDPFPPQNGDESAPLAIPGDPKTETFGAQFENYGWLKVLCEQAVEEIFPQSTTIIRPGYIAGPHDPTGRFTYWPVRADQGGEMAMPGEPSDPLQVIDVRDLAQWLIHLAENKIYGVFNACGCGEPLTMGKLMGICQQMASEKPNLNWISADFLENQENIHFPLWAPAEGQYGGIHTLSAEKAQKSGLRFRPIEETIKDTLSWYKDPNNERKNLAGPDEKTEKELLKNWQKTSFSTK